MYKFYYVTLTPAQESTCIWDPVMTLIIRAIGPRNGEALFAKYANDEVTINKVTYKVTRKITNESSPMLQTNICSQWAPEIFNPMYIGESRTSRGEYSGTWVTCAEYMRDAVKALKPILKSQADRENAYYSQQWV